MMINFVPEFTLSIHTLTVLQKLAIEYNRVKAGNGAKV